MYISHLLGFSLWPWTVHTFCIASNEGTNKNPIILLAWGNEEKKKKTRKHDTEENGGNTSRQKQNKTE